MALDYIDTAPVKPGAVAPLVPGAAPAGATKEQRKQVQDSKNQHFKSIGASERGKLSEDQKQAEGSESDSLAFIATLGNPLKQQPRREGKNDLPSHEVVGYRYKALKDTIVPEAKMKVGADGMYDVEEPIWKMVPAGQTFDTTILENAMLVTQSKYAGRITGGDRSVFIGSRAAESRSYILPIMSQIGGSIKEGMLLVGEVKVDANGGKKGTPHPEFADKFGVLFIRKSGARKTSTGGGDKSNSAADIAAAFQVTLRNKFGALSAPTQVADVDAKASTGALKGVAGQAKAAKAPTARK